MGLKYIRISPDHGIAKDIIGLNKASPLSLIRSIKLFSKFKMIQAKKSLGQNFLIDQNVIKKITALVKIKENNILEIGSGTGNLTNEIVQK